MQTPYRHPFCFTYPRPTAKCVIRNDVRKEQRFKKVQAA